MGLLKSEVRPPAVAGLFYPERSQDLSASLERLLDLQTNPKHRLAVLAPHAGYRFSGATAARAFAACSIPNRVIIIGPNHTGQGPALSVSSASHWSIPTGQIPQDEALIGALLKAYPALELEAAAHRSEHGIEVELPFLFHLNPAIRFAALVVSTASESVLRSLGEALATVVTEAGEDVLLIASSDMSHFLPAAVAAPLDQLALDRWTAVDGPGLIEVVRNNRISMCGALPASLVLRAATLLGASQGSILE